MIDDFPQDAILRSAHDIKTHDILAIGYVDFLLKELHLSLEQRSLLESIREMSRANLVALDNILHLFSSAERDTTFQRETFRILPLLYEVVDLFEPAGKLKGISIETSADKDLTVWADEAKIRSVLLNLLINALKMTQTGMIMLEAKKAGRQVQVTVTDTGPGIPEELLSSLFEKPSSSGKKKEGLGLYIVQKILERHGEEIQVESAPGRGTIFRFFLPESEEPQPGVRPFEEKRRVPRCVVIARGIPVRFQDLDTGRVLFGVLRDISTGGIGFYHPNMEIFVEGRMFRITLRLTRSGGPLELVGRIVWKKPAGTGEIYLGGMEFVPLNGEQESTLAEILSEI